jgi:hypothetical protein
MWQLHTANMAAVLGRSGSDEDTERELLPIMQRASLLFMATALHNIDNLRALHATAGDLDESEAEAERVESRWRDLVRDLEITKVQRDNVVSCWKKFNEQMERLAGAKARAVAAAQEAAAEGATDAPVVLGAAAKRHIRLRDAMVALTNVTDAQYVCLLELINTSGLHFRPLQKARVVSYSHPKFRECFLSYFFKREKLCCRCCPFFPSHAMNGARTLLILPALNLFHFAADIIRLVKVIAEMDPSQLQDCLEIKE